MSTPNYKTLLTNKIAILTSELESIASYTAETDDWEARPEHNDDTADENASADVTEEWTERSGTVAALETEYRSVRRALEKITSGAFGVCEICHQPISEKRLTIQPAARTCLDHLNEEATLPL